jgi:eukaryotic-like serine/threonine-protein kinase
MGARDDRKASDEPLARGAETLPAGDPAPERDTFLLTEDPGGGAGPDPELDRLTLPSENSAVLYGHDVGGVTREDPQRYEGREEIGRGALGRVFLAFDRHIGRSVAIKELLSGSESNFGGDASLMELLNRRFMREARVTGQLEHPAIMPVYEIGQRDDGTYYYAMRRVRGRTLSAAIGEAGSLQERLHLLPHFRDVCNAVAYAHSRGVIHRDLKPDNILIGEFGETVVLDWGLAKVLGELDADLGPLSADLDTMVSSDGLATVVGQAMGTPCYMPPEQALGDVDRMDARSDVYALGSILYEMLTGSPPFKGVPGREILVRVIQEAPPPVTAQAPDAPAELIAVAGKAQQKMPADRYDNAAGLAAEIEAHLTGAPVAAYDYSTWDVMRRFVRQHRALVTAVAAVVLALVVVVVVSAVSWQRERAIRERETTARIRETAAREREAAARGKADRMSQQLSRSVVSERQVRRQAQYHLAQAYLYMALRMERRRRFAAAKIYAAASLHSNPAQGVDARVAEAFAKAEPLSLDVLARAASVIHRSGQHPSVRLLSTARAPAGEQWGAVSGVAGLLASRDQSGTLRIRRLDNGALVQTLGKHPGRYDALDFAPLGDRLASVGKDGKLRLWQARSGKLLRAVTLGIPAWAVAFSPDGTRVAVGDKQGACTIFRVRDGRQTARLGSGGKGVFQLAWAPAGKRIAVVRWDRSAVIWQPGRPEPAVALPANPQGWHAAVFTPDGRRLFAADWGRTITEFDARTWKVVRRLQGHQATIYVMALSADGRLLISGGLDRRIVLWDLASRTRLQAIEGHHERIRKLAFLPDRRRFATLAWDRTVKVWQLVPGIPPRVIKVHPKGVTAVGISPDGKRFATGGWDRTIRLFDTRTGRLQRRIVGHAHRVNAVVFAPSGRQLASVSWDRTVRIWDTVSGKQLQILRGHRGPVYTVAWSPRGRRLVTAGRQGGLRVWDARSGKQLWHTQAHKGHIFSVDWSRTGGRIVTVGRDRLVKLWDPARSRVHKVLRHHTDWVSGASFSHDGRRLVTSGKDEQILLWDVASGRLLRRFGGHKGWINYVRFFPHGQRFASCGDDRTVRIRSLRTGRTELVIRTDSPVEAMALSPDGQIVLLGDGPRAVLYPASSRVLQQKSAALLSGAQRSVGLHLTGFRLAPVKLLRPVVK